MVPGLFFRVTQTHDLGRAFGCDYAASPTSLLEHAPILNKKCIALGDSCANVSTYAFPAGLTTIMK